MMTVRMCRCGHGDDKHEDQNWFCSGCQCEEFALRMSGEPAQTYADLPPEPGLPTPETLSDPDRAKACLRELASLPDNYARQVVARWCRVKRYTLLEPRE